MPAISAVAIRFAKALIEIVTQPDSKVSPADVIAQLKATESVIAESHDLRTILMTPAVSTNVKKSLMGKLIEGASVAPMVRNFLYVVLDHKRIAELSQIRQAFEELLDEQQGVVRATITSAAPLDGGQLQSIERELARLSGKKVRTETSVDPSLLGGVTARVGSTVYDGSLRGQLEALRRKLTSESADYKVGI